MVRESVWRRKRLAGALLPVNRLNEAEGRLRVALALPPGQHIPAGAGRVLRLHPLPVAGPVRHVVSIPIDGSLTSLQAVSPAAQPITLNHRGETQLVIE